MAGTKRAVKGRPFKFRSGETDAAMRHEIFCQGIVKGLSKEEAYRAAG